MTAIPDDALRETWESVYDKSVKLAALIEAHCAKTGERFDAMVVVPRGAYYPSNIISRELGFSATDLLHASIGSYEIKSTTRKAEFAVGQMPTAGQVKGKHLLIIEEVCDSGQTLKFLVDYLEQHGAELVRTGVLHYKPGQSQTGFKPDWAVAMTDKWIVYPWEMHERDPASSVTRR
jgi:uncharacterized protein